MHAHAHAIEAPEIISPTENGSMGLRGLWALVGNSTAMVVIAVSMLLAMYGAWTMHREAMSTMERMNQQNLDSMGKVIDRNTNALDALAKEIHALRTGGVGPDQ